MHLHSYIFRTFASIPVLNGTLTFDPFRVSLGVTSVTVTWTPLSTSAMAAITTLQIACRRSQDADNFTYHDLDPRVSHMTLEGLDPKTAYVSKFLVSLVNGTTITTAPLHFVTMSEGELFRADLAVQKHVMFHSKIAL